MKEARKKAKEQKENYRRKLKAVRNTRKKQVPRKQERREGNKKETKKTRKKGRKEGRKEGRKPKRKGGMQPTGRMNGSGKEGKN